MMATRKQNGMVMVVMATMMMAVAVMVVEVEGYECTVMRGDCRLVSDEEDGVVTRNISCYCEYGEEVSQPLHQLTKAKCLQEPGGEVNISILHINGCSVSRVFPVFLITKCRASAHLVIYVKDSPYISLPSHNYYTISRTAPAPRTITATFIQSNVSGMPEGVVNGATERAVVRVEGGKMDVLETRSFSGYPRDAQVSVSFKDTQILTVKQGAFDLPPTAQLKVEGGKMVRVETYSYSGGAKLFLSGVVVGNLLPSAVNIYGLMKLSVVNCTMAVVYANAFTHRAPTYVRRAEQRGE